MKNIIKKSMVGVVLLSVSMAVGFEEHKKQLINQEPVSSVALTIAIPEPATGTFQVTLPVVPLDQAAPKLAKVIATLGNPAVKQQVTDFFQAQTPDTLKDFNKAAKKALKPSAHNADQERAFIQKMRDCVQQGLQKEHETTRAALEQAHQQALQEVTRDERQSRKGILFATCMAGTSFGLAYGLVVLLITTGTCHN